MNKFVSAMAAAVMVTSGPAPLVAQAPSPAAISAVDQRQQRFRIDTMESVLERAVEQGAAVTRDRLQALLPADMLLSESARVRGYRLEGYGMFFDVAVPMLEGSMIWSFRTLDQNDLGLDSALKALRTVVEKMGDTNLEQALKRIELQVVPSGMLASLTAAEPAQTQTAQTGARMLTGSAAAADTAPAASAPRPADTDPILNDPQEAYRAEVRDALMDAMLEHSFGLALSDGELLTVAARGGDDRPRLGPADSDTRTVMISARGADLRAFMKGEISRDEARSRMNVRVF
jgi:hypothetical protein